MSVDLEGVLEVLGVDLATLASDRGEINLYTQFGVKPVAQLILKNDKFILRFGEDLLPTSACEILPTGAVRSEPANFKINKE